MKTSVCRRISAPIVHLTNAGRRYGGGALVIALACAMAGGCHSSGSTKEAAATPPTPPPAATPPPPPAPTPKKPEPPKVAALQPFEQPVPPAAFSIKMVPIPGDPAKGIAPFWMSATELTWEAFDVFVYRLDDQAPANADATTRPSKPYLPPDRGFGHEGYAAICMSHKNATAFCAWLSARTGRNYRLATEAEWELACRASTGADSAYGFDGGPTALADYAWFDPNSDSKTHPVGTKKPNAFGLFDMHGNVAEWVNGPDGKPVVKGGSYRDPAEKLTTRSREPANPAWNSSDPQIPKSSWWLADGPFIGFRIGCQP